MQYYKTLYHIKILHSYYKSHACPDLEIIPSNHCLSVLKGHRLQLKPNDNGFRIITCVDESDQLFIPLSGNLVLDFILKLKDPAFKDFTDLELAKGSGYLFSSQQMNIYQTSESVNTQSNVGEFYTYLKDFNRFTEYFEVKNPGSEEAFFLHHKPITTFDAGSFMIKGLEGVTQINTYDKDTKIITINTTDKAVGEPFEVSYHIPLRSEKNILGTLEIHNENLLEVLPGEPLVYTISFTPKQVLWKYYVVTNNINGDYSITDESGANTPLIFEKQEIPEDDRLYTKIKDTLPESDFNIHLFKADKKIPMNENPRAGIILKKGSNEVLNNLPNPNILDNGIRVVKVG